MFGVVLDGDKIEVVRSDIVSRKLELKLFRKIIKGFFFLGSKIMIFT